MSSHETTKQKILSEAKYLFGRDGYAAVSMATIASGVGITKASLYHFYTNKADIFCAVIEEITRHMSELCRIYSREPSYERFILLIEALMEGAQKEGNIILHIDPERIDMTEAQRTFLQTTFYSFMNTIAACLKKYTISDPTMASHALLTLIQGYTKWCTFDTTAPPISTYSIFIANLFYRKSTS